MTTSSITPKGTEEKAGVELGDGLKNRMVRFFGRIHRANIEKVFRPKLEYDEFKDGPLSTLIKKMADDVTKLSATDKEKTALTNQLAKIKQQYKDFYKDTAAGLPVDREKINKSIQEFKTQYTALAYASKKSDLEVKRGELKASTAAAAASLDELKKSIDEEKKKNLEEKKRIEDKQAQLESDKTKLNNDKSSLLIAPPPPDAFDNLKRLKAEEKALAIKMNETKGTGEKIFIGKQIKEIEREIKSEIDKSEKTIGKELTDIANREITLEATEQEVRSQQALLKVHEESLRVKEDDFSAKSKKLEESKKSFGEQEEKIKTDIETEQKKIITELDTAQKKENEAFTRTMQNQMDKKHFEILAMEALGQGGRDWKKRFWKRTDGLDENELAEAERKAKEPAGAAAKIGGKSDDEKHIINMLQPPGYFKREGSDYDIYATKDGYGGISIIPLPKPPADFSKAYGEVLDFMKGGLSMTSFTVDYHDESFVDIKEVRALIKMAQEKNLNIKLGPAVHDKLKTLSKDDPKLYKEIQKDLVAAEQAYRDKRAESERLAMEEAKKEVDARKQAQDTTEKLAAGTQAWRDKAEKFRQEKADKWLTINNATFSGKTEGKERHDYLNTKIFQGVDATATDKIKERGEAELDANVKRLKDLKELRAQIREQLVEIESKIGSESSLDKLEEYGKRIEQLERLRNYIEPEYKEIRARQDAVVAKMIDSGIGKYGPSPKPDEDIQAKVYNPRLDTKDLIKNSNDDGAKLDSVKKSIEKRQEDLSAQQRATL